MNKTINNSITENNESISIKSYNSEIQNSIHIVYFN